MRRRRWRVDDAATSVEYAILAVAIAVVIVLAVFAVGQQVQDDFECTQDVVTDPTYTCPE